MFLVILSAIAVSDCKIFTGQTYSVWKDATHATAVNPVKVSIKYFNHMHGVQEKASPQ